LRRIFLCGLLCIIFSLARPQAFKTPLSNIYTRANAYSTIQKDVFSFTGNQAALAENKQFSIGIYGESRFMLQELSSYQMAFALPTPSGNFGLQANYFGSSVYNESALGLAYARRLGKIDLGVQFNYFEMKASGYGNAPAVNFEAGAILHVTDQFQTGIHIYNPTRAGIGKNSGEKLPVIYSFGLGYDASENFFIGGEIEKKEDEPVNVNAGLQYAFDEKLFARAGISSATSSFYLGAGFLLNGFRIDVTASLHPSLGFTPGLLLMYTIPDKN
jgi:hypothetical protein